MKRYLFQYAPVKVCCISNLHPLFYISMGVMNLSGLQRKLTANDSIEAVQNGRMGGVGVASNKHFMHLVEI